MHNQRKLILPQRMKPYLMAHRGNKVDCPENTLAAFQRALLDGSDIIETDLHLSADDHLICIHDPTLDRTTDGSGAISELTLDQIKGVSASYGRAEYDAEKVPTLPELLEILPQGIGLALELKSDAFLDEAVCQRLADELQRFEVQDRTVILSFSMDHLHTFRKVLAETPTGWITLNNGWPISGVELIGPFWPWLFINPTYVAIAHRQSQLVCPLDPLPDRRLRYYKLLGCDAILSDNPAATARALGR